jgi:hypothetical protein
MRNKLWMLDIPVGFPDTSVYYDPVTAVIGGSVAGGLIGADGAESAADTQAGAARDAQASQERMFNTVNEQQKPYRDAGYTALNQIGVGTAPGGQFQHQFNATDLKSNLAPNYDFMLSQGLGAVNNQTSVSGGLIGGNALKGINDYAQNYASNGYQQAFDNYNTNQTNIFNRLASIAGLGQTSNGQTATAALGFGGNIGSAQLAGGAARAAGQVGSANAISGALNNASSWYMANNSPSSSAGYYPYGGSSLDIGNMS